MEEDRSPNAGFLDIESALPSENDDKACEVKSTSLELQNTHHKDDQLSPVHVKHIKRHKGGLFNAKATIFLLLWYIFSGCTLYSNKYILEYHHQDPNILGCTQVLTTTVCGFFQLTCCFSSNHSKTRSPKFFSSLLQLGAMRFATVVLGLVALKHVTVSFTETVKSSAPVFTVVIAKLLLVVLSLLPIMIGLGLASSYDLNFNVIGFCAALANNVADCLQNVFSKLLISSAEFEFHPIELQFYTSIASILMQLPISYLMINSTQFQSILSPHLLALFLLNGLAFHMQSYTAYSLMSYISPVTYSVANTVKRAILIWLSIFIFRNAINVMSAVGMVLVTIGVALFNGAKLASSASSSS